MNITKTRYAIDGTDRFVEHEQIPIDFLINIPVIDKNNKMLGRAVLTKSVYMNKENGTTSTIRETVVLTDIIVYDPENRGKGVGDNLMGFITGSGYFDVVITGISTESGRELCLKWGFKQETIKETKLLVWRKEHKDAVDKKG